MIRVLFHGLVSLGLIFTGETLLAQTENGGNPQTPDPLVVPAGDRLLLRVQNPLNTKGAEKGDPIELKMVHDLFLGDQMVLPRGLSIRATVTRSHRRRPITVIDRPELHFRIDQMILPDGSSIPMSAKLLRAGFIEFKQRDSGEVELVGQGAGKRGVASVGGSTARGAILGGPIGAAVGAASGMIAQSMARRRDLELPRGITFEIELARDLEIPAHTQGLTEWHPSRAARVSPLPLAPPALGHTPASAAAPPDSIATPRLPLPTPARETEDKPVDANSVRSTHPIAPPGAFTLKVLVDLVTVEGVVRDSKGRLMEDLKHQDFRILDDRLEQQITHFSRDQLPLAVALVIDEVAVFAFADSVVRLVDLTGDRQAAAEQIAGLSPTGGTNIYDAIFDASQYLRAAAPDRRRAIILVSDNQPTTLGRASESGAIRMALESETVVYSVKTPGAQSIPRFTNLPPRFAAQALLIGDRESVPRIARETGGEVLDAAEPVSLSEALASVISRLKSRYTLGYTPSNHSRDGRFHRIEVKLTERFGRPGESYTVHTRRGFYASALSQSSR